VAEVGGRNRAEALEAPFVGRQEEMRLLKDLLHTTEREKRLRVVSVIGPGGIGKSRLAWELLKYIDGLIGNIYWHSGRSPAYGEGISFWALGEMVRERAGLAERDDEAMTRQKITETVEQWVTDPAERTWIEPALLTLLGVEAGMASDQLFPAWRTFFERISADGPVVLVFEDMHYADAGLLEFVDHMLEWSRGFPIYVVTLARPDLIERRPDWGAGKRNFVSMYLEPLSEPHMRELLAGLVPGLPDSAVATIVGRADGIPLYAVETVRTLLAEGRLVEQDGKYVPQGDLTNLTVPETLTALIAARLDTLDETDRRIVHDAAVLGQSFTLSSLAAVAEVPEAELEPRLVSLVRRELLQRQMDPRSPERGQYAFVQALIREVAYNTLAKKDRKRLHLAAARHFESLGNDEIAGALASHYLAAYANAAEGEEADALSNQARIALKAAATRASALGGYGQAHSFLEQALSIVTEPTERLDIMIKAAEAAEIAARLEQSERLLRSALELAREVGDRPTQAIATAELVRILRNNYRVDESKQLLEPAVAELGDIDDPGALARLKGALAGQYMFANEPRRSLALVDEILDVAEPAGMTLVVARNFLGKGNALMALGRRREAMGIWQSCREIAEEHGMTDLLLRAMGNLANWQTDFKASMDAHYEGYEVARKAGHRDSVLSSIANFGYAAFGAGEWDRGLAEMEPFLAEDIFPFARLLMMNNILIIKAGRGEDITEGLAELERIGKEMSGGWHQFVADPSANAFMAAGEFAKASEQYMEMVEDPTTAPEYLYRSARALLWIGELDTAKERLAAAEGSGGFGPIEDARRATLRAGIAACEARSAEALALYREALNGWRFVHGTWDEAMTGLDMATLLDPAEPEVAAALTSTRAILERLKAQPYLDRLDTVLESKTGQVAQPARRAETAEVAVSE
jgi:tetratricopeptide (TPR) repeat protein